MSHNRRRWSEAAKQRNRRRRAARRLYAKYPLLAVPMMRDLEERGGNGEFRYPDYTYSQLEQDLKRKNPPKKRRGKSKAATFKKRLLAKWKSEIFWQVKLEQQANPELVRKYYMLLNNPSPYVQARLNFQGKVRKINIPHIATEASAKTMIEFINKAAQSQTCAKELDKLINNYIDENFHHFGG